jgi:membrane-bound lytic murein transglycosylase A
MLNMCRKIFVPLLIVAGLFLNGCKKEIEAPPQYDKPLPPGAHALRLITDPEDIPDFTIASCELDNLRQAIAKSLNYLNKPSSQKFFPNGQITHYRAVSSLKAFADLLDAGIAGKALASTIRQKFDVYTSVGCDNRGTVLFTGYYTPIFDGALEPSERFQYPLYSQPKDLLKDDYGDTLGRKLDNGQIVPYSSRQQLTSSGQLKGTEIAWLSDPFEVYIAHVQGSAKIRTARGELITVGYAANNGYEYKSVAHELIKDGKINSAEMNLTIMIEYFKNHPDLIDQYVARNPRFVFFQLGSGEPRGSLNEPVTTLRTIATDKSIYPRACLAFVSTRLPRDIAGAVQKRTYTGFALDQDTGGAIRAPGRCDVYIGIGDRAGMMAGQVYEEGRLYYLFLKPRYMSR